MVVYYTFVFVTLTWVCFSSEELFKQTVSNETVSSEPSAEIKNDTQPTTIDSLTTSMTKAVYDTVEIGINNVVQNDYNISSYKDSKIVGGYQTHEGEIPYQVSVRGKHGYAASYGHFCGGSVITSIHVLTAAHCMFEQNIYDTYVTAGSYDLQSADAQSRGVYSVYIHEGFDKDSNINDISIIQVEYPFIFGRLTLPVQVASWSQRVAVGTNCIVSGWGRLNEDYVVIPRYLHAVVVPTYNTETCARHYVNGSQLPDGMICAGLDSGGKDACQGDSGGPMVCNGYLTGIVSWGNGCARNYYPGVYTDVAFYYEWIHLNTNGFSSATSSYPTLISVLVTVSCLLYLL